MYPTPYLLPTVYMYLFISFFCFNYNIFRNKKKVENGEVKLLAAKNVLRPQVTLQTFKTFSLKIYVMFNTYNDIMKRD